MIYCTLSFFQFQVAVGDVLLTCDVFYNVNKNVRFCLSTAIHTSHWGSQQPSLCTLQCFLWQVQRYEGTKILNKWTANYSIIYKRIQNFGSNNLLVLFVYWQWEMFILHLWPLQVPCWIWSVLLTVKSSVTVLTRHMTRCRPGKCRSLPCNVSIWHFWDRLSRSISWSFLVRDSIAL